MANPIDAITAQLWTEFKNNLQPVAPVDVNNGHGPGSAQPSNKWATYQNNLFNQILAGNWNTMNADEVKKCCRQAGNTAKLISQSKGEAVCSLATFDLACTITEQAYRIRIGAAPSAAGQGIIC